MNGEVTYVVYGYLLNIKDSEIEIIETSFNVSYFSYS